MKIRFNILSVLFLFLVGGLAFSFSPINSVNSKILNESKSANGPIDTYKLLGINFSYYKIPQNLSREELISAAQKLHENEPDANLILVDDDSKLNEFIKFAKVINPGYNDPEMPKEWADKHLVATVRKSYWSGKTILYTGYGNEKISELK
jgi:hypothetical protein